MAIGGLERACDVANVSDIVELAKALEDKYVVPAEARCVVVRNRNGKCRRCVDACINEAIKVWNNKIEMSPFACVGCGSCIAVCPTEALVPINPLDEEFAAQVAVATSNAGVTVISCARAAAWGYADPTKYASVPCLGRMGETMLLELAARGVEQVCLVDGDCTTCKYGAASENLEATLDSACNLLWLFGSDMEVERMSDFPEVAMHASEREALAASRRGFFSTAGGKAKDVAMTAAEKTVSDALNMGKAQKLASLRDRLGIAKGAGGKLPHFPSLRNERILNALYELGECEDETLTTRLFGRIEIDAEKCNGCGMCTMFCPTAAIRKSEEEHSEEGRQWMEFSAADCVQCGLCADACLKKCITLSKEVPVEELFSFEPRLIEASIPPKKGSILGRKR